MGKVCLVLLMATATIATAACGGGGGGGPAERVVDFSGCDTKPDVGASALKGHATKTEWVVSDFFEKPYDRFDLEAVLDASSTSTTDYVSSLGITLFKVPRANPTKQCPTYFNLAAAQGPYQQIWTQAAGENIGNGALAGLFFEFCGPGTRAACRARAMVQPTILVDEVSDRWTLVHELMHYNFNQGRKADLNMPTTAELENELRRSAKTVETAMKDFKDLPNRQDLTKAAEALRSTLALGRQMLARRSFEEVAIEALLIDEYSRGNLRNVSLASAKSGVWYMKFSRDAADKELRPYAPMIAAIKKAAEDNFWDDVSQLADETTAQIEAYQKELNDIIADAERKVAAAEEAARDSDEDFPTGPQGFLAWDQVSMVSRNLVQDHERIEFEKHLESHDRDGLKKAFSETTKELEAIFDSTL